MKGVFNVLEGLFGKDNDMLIWIVIAFLFLSGGFGGKDDCGHGGKKGGGIFGDNMIIWIVIIFLFLNNDNDKHDHNHDHNHC